jgi:hypothetical protein
VQVYATEDFTKETYKRQKRPTSMRLLCRCTQRRTSQKRPIRDKRDLQETKETYKHETAVQVYATEDFILLQTKKPAPPF